MARAKPARSEAHPLGIIRNGGQVPSEVHNRLINRPVDLLPTGRFAEDGFNEQKFRKFAKQSREGSRNVLKLLLSYLTWGNETFPLYATIGLSLYEGIKGNTDAWGAFNTLDVLGSIFFHVLCVVLRFAVEYANESTFRTISYRNFLLKFLASLFLVFKPCRYLYAFYYRYRRSIILDDYLKNRKDLDKEAFKAVIDLNNQKLKDTEYEMTQVHVQSLPMVILQLYILFSNNQSFTVCSYADLARLWFIVGCIYSAAKATTDNDTAYSKARKAYNFLYKFENPSHPVNLNSGGCCVGPFMSLLSLFRNTLFTLHRFYCISFFLAVNPYLALTYIAAVLVSQWLMLQIFPEQTRLPFENPPYGIHTFWSDLLQQWTNLFSNYRTKLDWVSSREFKVCGFRFHLSLSLLQIIPFVTSMVVVFSAAHFLGGNDVDELTESLRDLNRTGLDNPACPDVKASVLTHFPRWAEGLVNFVFQAHSNANHRFTSVKEVFGVFHFLPFSMYFYFTMSLTYSYALSQMRLINPLFPVLQGYRMWHSMIFPLLCNQFSSRETKQRFMRRLMLLTQIFDDFQFYRVYERFKLEKACGKCAFRGSFNQAMSDVSMECVRKYTKSSEALEHDLRTVRTLRHPLNNDFFGMIDSLESEDDKRIFIVFYSTFDNRMRDLSSTRAKATFHMMGVSLDLYKYDFDCTF